MLTKRNKILFIPLLVTILFASCKKYEVAYEGAYDDASAIEPTSIDDSRGIIYVESGKLYMINAALNQTRVFSTLPTGIRYASINNAHDKIAYKTITGNITIIDTLGNKIATIDSSSVSTQFDWHPNNNTLCYLNNLALNFYGPSVDLAIKNFDVAEVFPATTISKKVLGYAIKENGGVVYWIQYYSPTSGWANELIYDNKNGADYRKKTSLPLISVTSWMRLSAKSDNPYFGYFNITTSSSIFYSYNAVFSYNDFNITGQGGSFLVQSPGGFGNCSVNNSSINVKLYDKYFQKNINGFNITALDW
jgi:hypothetical protein